MIQTYRGSLSVDEGRPGVLYFGGVRMALLDIEAGFWALRRQMEALAGRRLTDAVLQQAGANGGASFLPGLLLLTYRQREPPRQSALAHSWFS